MKSNFEACLAETLSHEGGWADHPKDPGGATMKGVTIGTYERFKGRKVTKAELKAISDYDLKMIYRRGYWDEVRGDELPAGLDMVAFDGAVNSGPSRGIKWLQAGVGAQVDGLIGPATIAAANRVSARDAINRACDARMFFLRGLSTWPTFGKGWQRRVETVRAKALEMALDAGLPDNLKPKPPHVNVSGKNKHDAGDVLTPDNSGDHGKPIPHPPPAPANSHERSWWVALIEWLFGKRN